MNSNTPPQDSDAEIDKLFCCECDGPDCRHEIIGKHYILLESEKQAIQALRKRWEAEAVVEFGKGCIAGPMQDGYYTMSKQGMLDRLIAFQNQLPTKEDTNE